MTTATASGRDPAHEAARVLRHGGRLAWGFVGIVLAASIVLSALAVASSVVLPLFLAVVLATLFRPLVRWLERFRLPASLASGVVVVSIVLGVIGVVWMVVVAIVREGEELLRQLESALGELGIDEAATQSISEAIESLVPTVLAGVAEAIVSGIDTLSGFIAGVVLGILILYYMLKEGGRFLRAAEQRMLPGRADQLGSFATDAATVMRRYYLGRTIVSAVVAGVVAVAALAMGLPMVPTLAVVTFVGGYIPYIGAFIGGLLAVVVAIAEEGLGAGVLILVVVLVANLLVENMVDPHVTGRTLRIHPLVVLLVTTVGGVLGGLIGLMLAVPMTVIGVRAVRYVSVAFEGDDRRRAAMLAGSRFLDGGEHVAP